MPIAFACSCGKRFRVNDELAGKKTRCPGCQQLLTIPQAESLPPAAAEQSLISFTCACGKALRAKAELAGKKTRCPACQAPVEIPASLAPPEPDYEPYEEEQPAAEQADYEPYEEEEQPANEPEEPQPRSRKKPELPERYRHLTPEKPARSLQEYCYWGLLLFLIPLGLSLLIWNDDSVEDRRLRTLRNAPEEVLEKIESIYERIERRVESERARSQRSLETEEDDAGMTRAEHDEIIRALPGSRIEGAHLPVNTIMHWFYALGAIVVFLGIATFLFPQAGQPLHLFGIGLFTGTIGILLLLAFQWIADVTQGHILVSRNLIITVVYWLLFMIGFSYRAALDPESSFVGSLLGYTFGVGLCEEICKALPLIWYYRRPGLIGWREACTWGFASGAGFGVAEGIIYAADFYNGFATLGTYIVRFVSCVALHAIWTASVALFIYKFQYFLQEEMSWHDWPPRLLFLVAIPAILHGLYDTFLKKDLNFWALVTALVSFAWFVYRIELARTAQDPEDAEPRGKKKKRKSLAPEY